MFTAILRGVSRVVAKPAFKVGLQALVSIALLIVLVNTVQSENLLANIQAISLASIVIAIVLQLAGFLVSILRWRALLVHAGIHEPYWRLASLYFIGLFCSLFLPTGTGGDAFRAYEVARSSGKPAVTVMATLQDRLIGLGTSFLIGLVATVYFFAILPEQLRVWALVLQIAGCVAVGVLIYASLIYQVATRLFGYSVLWAMLRRMLKHPLIGRIATTLRPVLETPPLPLKKLVTVLGLASVSNLMGIAIYPVFSQISTSNVSFFSFCLIVPLVWVARMAPISLGGLGVSEGTFAFLMTMFGVASADSLVLAFGVLAVQTSFALFGGVLLLIRVVRGNRINVRQPGT